VRASAASLGEQSRRLDYPHAARLLITADAGGSNSYRFRL